VFVNMPSSIRLTCPVHVRNDHFRLLRGCLFVLLFLAFLLFVFCFCFCGCVCWMNIIFGLRKLRFGLFILPNLSVVAVSKSY
jgi:hypothetical protein